MNLRILYKLKTLIRKGIIFIILLLAPFFPVQLNAQFQATKVIRSNNIMTQDGSKYYMHEIKGGQTLYSVSKAYNVTQKDITLANPNVRHLSEGTLPLGVVIRIPYVEPEEASTKPEKDTLLYTYHIVEPKETLSSLSRLYKVHYKKIIEHNPGVEEKLLIGNEIRIPIKQEIDQVQTEPVKAEPDPVVKDIPAAVSDIPAPDTVYIYHTVKKGENIFRLASMYGLKMRDLKAANPESGWFIKENEIVKIPVDLITNPDMIPVEAETEQDKDEEVSVIDDEKDIIKEEEDPEIKRECIDLLKPHNEELYEIAFMLPLYLDINDTLHIHDTLPYSNYDIYDVRFLEFLEGAYMAIDSLKDYGLRVNVNIYDTERNPEVVRDLFESGWLNDTDIIIGPVYSSPLSVASEYSRKLQIPIVSPLSDNGTGLDSNPYLFQVNPGERVQYDIASDFLTEFHDKNLIIIQDTTYLDPLDRTVAGEKVDYIPFRILPSDLISGNISFNPEFSKLLPQKVSASTVEDLLSKERENLVIVPSENEIFVTDFVNTLNALSLYYDITLFGMPGWGNYEALEMEYLYNLKFHYYTNFKNPFTNYQDSVVNQFCHNYRLNWNNEPSRFSLQGFDVSYYFFRALYLYGREFTRCVSCLETVLNHSTMQTEFCFRKLGPESGYENQAISIIRYNAEILAKEKIKSARPKN